MQSTKEQVSHAVAFEEAAGLPFVFQYFTRRGSATLLDVLGTSAPLPAAPAPPAKTCERELPLDGDVLAFWPG
ncbi:MAG: hypothetical protein EOO56_19020 [Hymenobacter sp.]|nr:MAG: hypothetical protein EOO56_19020 [Hymenobacter sp.]